MNTTLSISENEQDRFWDVVRQCLHEFHVHHASAALPKAALLQGRVNDMASEQMESFYHAEPFDVACDLANNHLSLKDHLDQYLAIRDKD